MRKGEATTTIADFEFNAGSRRDIQPPVGAIEVIRVGLLRLAEDDRPPLLTREDIGLMALEEVRHALVEVARLRKEYRQREQMGEGDEAIVAWLKWEFHWLMERMQAPQERAPE